MEQMADIRSWGGQLRGADPGGRGPRVIFTRDPARRRLGPRAGAARGRAGLLRAHLVPARVRGARPRPRIAQCSVSFNQRRGTLRGLHYQAAPARGGQARAVHPRRHLRRDRRPAARTRPPSQSRRRSSSTAENRQDALHPEGVRARLPDARGRHRGLLPDVRVLRSPSTRAACAGTIPPSASPGRSTTARSSERDRNYPDFRPALSLRPMEPRSSLTHGRDDDRTRHHARAVSDLPQHHRRRRARDAAR